MSLKPLQTKPLPKTLPLRKLIGPSFILLGMGLGSGELILWPYLTSNYGMGIMWGAILGITLQFFMNMEIERYALARGESIFVGFARKFRYLPVWFLLSTFVPWIWPGIAAGSATLFGELLGFENIPLLTIAMLVIIGLILSVGPVLYSTVESLQKYLTLVGVPAILLLTIYLADKVHWVALANGLVGRGDGYNFLPVGIPLASFLAAFAYSGAGGNLNLAQSYYVREKGYGMGAYAEKIRGLFSGAKKDFSLEGNRFEATPENVAEFKKWWRNINIEHFFVFLVAGAITMLLLGLLAFITVYKDPQVAEGLSFLVLQGDRIGNLVFPLAGTFFLVVAATMLFSTQLGVFDATSRILAENLVLVSSKLQEKNVPKIYYSVLWTQIVAGIIILSLGVTQPLQLIVIAAVLNAFAMFIHAAFTLWLNLTILEKEIRPNMFRSVAMTLAVVFYGGFSLYTLVQHFT